MHKQIWIKSNSIKERQELYNYFSMKKFTIVLPEATIVCSNFPIVIDYDDNTLFICNSITACGIKESKKGIITYKDFIKMC